MDGKKRNACDHNHEDCSGSEIDHLAPPSPRFAENILSLAVCLPRRRGTGGKQAMLRAEYRVDLAVLEIQLSSLRVGLDQKSEPFEFGRVETTFRKAAK